MKLLLSIVIYVLVAIYTTGCKEQGEQSTSTKQEGKKNSSSKPYHQYTASDIVDMSETDLLLAIKEFGFDDKGVVVFTERLKKVAPEMNKELGNTLKQEFKFDWYVTRMLALKVSEQMFRALDKTDVADEVGKAVESLEIAWSENDLHDILNVTFYGKDVDNVLDAIIENMTEEQKKKLTVNNIPVKELAKRLLEQADKVK